MPGIIQLGGWCAAAAAVVLSVLFGPVFAAYVFVAGSFVLIALVMGQQAARVIDDWRLNHPWKPHRTAHPRS
jgi:hypothetical protein